MDIKQTTNLVLIIYVLRSSHIKQFSWADSHVSEITLYPEDGDRASLGKNGRFNYLMQLSAQENHIEFCLCENYRT